MIQPEGHCARVLQRVLALTDAIWHNETSGASGARTVGTYLRPLTTDPLEPVI